MWWIPVILTISAPLAAESSAPLKAEERAVRFLAREVPFWFKGNGCYSCHNNGDAARALFTAARNGYRIPPSALQDTLKWLSHPERWDKNKGDPAFSDKHLADVQFAAATASAVDHGFLKGTAALGLAVRRLTRIQGANGAWTIDAGAQPGSPTTYGTALATYLSWKTLKDSKSPEASAPLVRSARWLQRSEPRNMVDRAAVILFSADSKSVGRIQQALPPILAAQTISGGWGPFADSRPEVFDTSIALLALARVRNLPGVERRIQRARTFLVGEQNPDGSWPETTRPAGGESYAQRISTPAWTLLALLETRAVKPPQRTRKGSRTVSDVNRR